MKLIDEVGRVDGPTGPVRGLKVIAYVSDEISVKRILAELGLNPPEEEGRRPPIREVVRVPVDDEGWEIHGS